MTIAGRVLNYNGSGIAKAKLNLTNQLGETRHAMTNTFGYYRLDGVAEGETYVLTVMAKNHNFSQPTVLLNVVEEINEMNFVGEP